MDKVYEVLNNSNARTFVEYALVRSAQLAELESKDPITMTMAEVMNGKGIYSSYPDFFGYNVDRTGLIIIMCENYKTLSYFDTRKTTACIRGIWEYHSDDIRTKKMTINEAIDAWIAFKKSIDDVDEETKAEVDAMVKEAEAEAEEEEG